MIDPDEFVRQLKETISYDESELVQNMKLKSFELTDMVSEVIGARLMQADKFMIQQAIHSALCRVRGAGHTFQYITDKYTRKEPQP